MPSRSLNFYPAADSAERPERQRRRRRSEDLPTSGRERAAVITASLLVTWVFWSFGSRPPNFLIGYFTLAVMVIVVPQLPPWGRPLEFLKSGVKSPIVWASILATLYPLIQALNPAYIAIAQEVGVPKIEAIDHITWLPNGVRSDLSLGTPLRHLLTFGGAGIAIVSLSLLLTKRSSWIAILWAALINGSLMAFVGTLAKMSGAKKILWLFDSVNPSFFGTVIYKNHAAAVLYLTITIAALLYFYHARQTRARGLKSGPHLLCLLLIAMTFFPVYMTDSKAGMILTALVTVCCFFLWVIDWLLGLRESGNLRAGLLGSGVAVCVIVALAGTLGRQVVDLEKVQDQIFGLKDDLEVLGEENIEQASHSNRQRYIAMIAFSEMLKERPALGVGAGCFEHFSREYSSQYPDIYYSWFDRKLGGWRTWHWKDAHSDWLEFPIELGWGGFALLILSFLSWLPGCFGTLKNPRIYFFVPWIGVGAMLGHAIFEFVFQLPLLVFLFMIVWSSPWFLYNLKRS